MSDQNFEEWSDEALDKIDRALLWDDHGPTEEMRIRFVRWQLSDEDERRYRDYVDRHPEEHAVIYELQERLHGPVPAAALAQAAFAARGRSGLLAEIRERVRLALQGSAPALALADADDEPELSPDALRAEFNERLRDVAVDSEPSEGQIQWLENRYAEAVEREAAAAEALRFTELALSLAERSDESMGDDDD